MLPSPQQTLRELIAQAYSKAYVCHGDLRLDPTDYEVRLFAILQSGSASAPIQSDDGPRLRALHTNDLYLTTACAGCSDYAWERFVHLYQKPIERMARSAARSRDAAHEVAGDLVGYLFEPDRSGRSRIASYQGLGSLECWLSVLLCRRSVDAERRGANQYEPLDAVDTLRNEDFAANVERAITSGRYEKMVKSSLRHACLALTTEERSLLASRYEEGVPVKRIAELRGVTPQTVIYHLRRAQEKLRNEVLSTLGDVYRLGDLAVNACVEDMLTNPAHSLLELLRESPA